MPAPAPVYSEFLRLYPPFDRFEAEALAFLDLHLKAARFVAGNVLVSPNLGEPQSLFILARGQVLATEAGIDGVAGITLSVGECFPIGALTGRRPPANSYTALTDLEMLQLPAAKFHQLMKISPAFTRYCSGYLAGLVTQSRQQLQARYAQQASAQQSLNTPLHTLIKRAPISVTSATPIQRAVEIMGEHKTGSVIVVNGDGAPIGVLTQSDVVQRIVLGRVPLERPINEVMSHDPMTLPETASAYEAMFAMASRGVRHLLLVDDAGRLTGVISEHNLFALQRVGLGQVRRAIESADTTDALRQSLREVQQSVFNMLAQGIGAEQLTQFISTLNDAVTERVLQLNLLQHPLDDIQWSWLAFGSEGREEQTLATDQDNGIVFLPPPDRDPNPDPNPNPEPARARLLAFAQAVNADLDRCGFPLCKGNIMAGNPEWCLTLDEWKTRFSNWIRNPHPEALLNATIFFDFRPLHGQRELAKRMHEHLFEQSTENSAFQRMLAQNALSVAPPLGMIRDFVTETDEDGKAFIDLKKFGARLFVDGARLLALAHGTNAASTIKRLRRTAKQTGGVGDEVEAMIDAFNFIQLLRLRHQHLEAGQGRPGDNRIYVEPLNQLDRRILKEAFRQARKLQQRLKLNYQL
jgi:CBS domain-containing protein